MKDGTIRAFVLLAVALLLPACGTTSDNGVHVVFSDDFSAGALGPAYTVDAGSVVIDGAAGNPLPSAQFPTGGPNTFRTTATYKNRGLTFSVDLAVDTATGSATFAVEDEFSSWVVSAQMTNGQVTFSLNPDTVVTSFTWAAGEFHTISFESTKDGVMSWKLDGFPRLTAGAVWAPTQLRLSVSGADAHADNFRVTTTP
jgi:hypothetical protein